MDIQQKVHAHSLCTNGLRTYISLFPGGESVGLFFFWRNVINDMRSFLSRLERPAFVVEDTCEHTYIPAHIRPTYSSIDNTYWHIYRPAYMWISIYTQGHTHTRIHLGHAVHFSLGHRQVLWMREAMHKEEVLDCISRCGTLAYRPTFGFGHWAVPSFFGTCPIG